MKQISKFAGCSILAMGTGLAKSAQARANDQRGNRPIAPDAPDAVRVAARHGGRALASLALMVSMPAMAQVAAPISPNAAGSPDQPALAPAASPPAVADQAGNGATLQDIIVTAQRRGERLQSVPVTITAFSGESLAAAGITDTQALQQVTPGLIMNKSLDSSAPFLRGVGSPDVTPSNEAAVATYLDGFYLISTSGGAFSLSNVERIEVLKGPQGTLFGRNTTGGLIQIITRAPSETLTGNIEAGYGNYHTFSGRGYLSGGLGGGFSADVAVAGSDQSEGWGVNRSSGRDVNLGNEVTARGKLRWHDDATDITAGILYIRRRGDIGSTYQAARGGSRSVGGSTFASTGKYNTNSDLPSQVDVNSAVPTLSINHDFGNFSVVSLSSYQYSRSHVGLDADGSPFRIANGLLASKSKGATQELQIVSSPASKFKWIAGLYGLTRRGAYDPSTIGVPFGVAITNGVQRTTSLSAFGQVTAPLGEATNLTAGLRYSHDRAKAHSTQTFNGFSSGPESYADRIYNKLSYRVSLDHKFSDNILAYASYNRGFKAGLFSVSVYPIAKGETQPEKIDAFEAGVKADLLGNKLRVNLAAFYYDYSNIQVFFFLNGTARVLNAEKARMSGGEAEITYRPVRQLTLHAGAAVLPESKYINFSGAPITTPNTVAGGNFLVTGQVAGNRAIRSPHFSGDLSATYTVPISSGNIELNGSAAYTGKFFWSVDNRFAEGAHTIYNASIKVNLSSGLSASVWGKNLANKYIYNSAQVQQEGDFGIPGPPRTYGITLGYHF